MMPDRHLLIVDDHPVMRRGIKQILDDSHRRFHTVEAATPSEALELIRRLPPHLVILDIGLGERGGLDLLKQLKHEHPRIPVLILSMHSEDQYGVRALRAGAAGYVTKEMAPERLVEAIERLLAGGRYISPALADRLAVELTTNTARPVHDVLSDREFDVFRKLAAGLTVSEIARELSLSVKTISGYRSNILSKTGLANNAAIMKYALEHKLLQ